MIEIIIAFAAYLAIAVIYGKMINADKLGKRYRLLDENQIVQVTLSWPLVLVIAAFSGALYLFKFAIRRAPDKGDAE